MPAERQRVADEIVEQLRSSILTGQYRPGSKLPPERELAKSLGVNRASLREALKKLEHMGLVRIRQGDGTRVENFMETAGLELLAHLLPLAQRSYPEIIRDALEFRRLVAREIARLAAERRSPADLVRLRELADGAAAPGVSHAEIFQLDFDFYIVLIAAAKNRVIGLLTNTVREAIKSYNAILVPLIVSPEVVREHHARLLAAIEAQKPDEAAAAVEDYMTRGTEHVLRLLGGGALPIAPSGAVGG